MNFVSWGIRYVDGLHLACAESASCEVLLTTDDNFLAKSQANKHRIMTKVANPLRWLAEVNLP